MAGIVPIPNTRVSNLFARQRLMGQLQADQLDIFRLQSQVSTGLRISLPSEDAPAARRAITLQRLLERKEQLRANVQTGKSFLQATDVALNSVSTLLGDVRGTALGAASTTATPTERTAAVEEVSRAIEQLLATANTQFRGRYLFAGSQTNVEPYSAVNGFVRYDGDGQTIRAFSDIGVLFGANASGLGVFGGISNQVLGGADLDPEVTLDAPLSSLRNGRGISPNGALQISDGSRTSIVDLSNAATVGDVLRKIEAHPPAGRTITASLTPSPGGGSGIKLQLDSAGGGALTVTEVASGKAAHELGVFNSAGAPPSGIIGEDLEPIITRTTRLNDLLGAKARTRLVAPGNNNDVTIEAAVNGSDYNGVTVQLVDDKYRRASGGLTRGNEYAEYDPLARRAVAALEFSGTGNDLILTASTPGKAYNDVDVVVAGAPGVGNAPTAAYDPALKRLTVTVDDAGATTVEDVLQAINDDGTFTAAHDPSVEAGYNPAAAIAASDVGVVRGSTGNSGGDNRTLYIYVEAEQSTAEDVVAAVNAEGTFNAAIDTLDMTSAVEAGTQDIPVHVTAVTAGGSGATLDLASGIRVTNAGKTHTIRFEGAETVEDLLNVLNGSDAQLHAEINADGSGVNVRSRLSGADFQIAENGGQTAAHLGIRSLTGETRLAELNYGVGVPTKAGVDHTIKSANLELRTRDDQVFNIDLSGAATVGQAATAINAATGASLTAQTNPDGGLTLIDNTVGQGAIAVIQSGPDNLISGGIAAHAQAVDFTITARNGQSYNINLAGAKTIDEVIAAINARTGGVLVQAQLAVAGNGIELVDETGGSGNFTITAGEGSQAAQYLGLIPSGQTTYSQPVSTITGSDQQYLDTPSVFTTLVRLRDAIKANDVNAMERAIALIDQDLDRVVFARSEVGARQQALDLSQQSLEDEDVQLRSALSEEIEVDMVEAISNLTARQASMEASLRATANILQLSLLNFL